ncbi:MAG: helix-turn-helix domain-containing protein [Velocimicrobium sp.]
MNTIQLNTKEELNIYMNPVRQQLLRQLNIHKAPMTPKMIAQKLFISSSAVTHHIKKLMTIELIELDHQELIHGITANYYKVSNVTVQIGLEREDDTTLQRQVFMQNSIANVYEGFQTQLKRNIGLLENQPTNATNKWGDILTGIVHLQKEESEELLKLISKYIKDHSKPTHDTLPWEYALILYNTEENYND